MQKNRFTTSPQVPVGAFSAAARIMLEGARMEAQAVSNLGAQIGSGIRRSRDQRREDERRTDELAESARRFNRQQDRLDRSLDLQEREAAARGRRQDRGLELQAESLQLRKDAHAAETARQTRAREDQEDSRAAAARRMKNIQTALFRVQAQEKMLGGATQDALAEVARLKNTDPLFAAASAVVNEGFNAGARMLRETHGNPTARRDRAASLRGMAKNLTEGNADLDKRSRAQVEGQAALLEMQAKRHDLTAKTMDEANRERDRFKAFLGFRDKALNRIKLHNMSGEEAQIVMGELLSANESGASADKMNQLVEQSVNSVMEQRRDVERAQKAIDAANKKLNGSSKPAGEDAKKDAAALRKEVLTRYDKEAKTARDRVDDEVHGATPDVDLKNYNDEALKILAQDRPLEKPRIQEEMAAREVSRTPGQAASSLMLQEVFRLSEERFGKITDEQAKKLNNLSPEQVQELLSKLRG